VRVTTASLISTHTIESWLASFGYVVVFALVMLESLGLPVPGETALIAAAVVAGSTHRLDIGWVIAVAATAAIVGDNIGFTLGRRLGTKILIRYGHRVRLNESRLRIGMWLFRHHGGKVVFFGRFVAVLRTYAAFLAGANRMSWLRFLVSNAAGGVLWATVFGLGYYAFGDVFERVGTAIDIVLGIAGALAVVGFVVWVRRKEAELSERAERELGSETLRA
jgi:membrane protein DedA with SNARE-associated domain